MNKNTTHDDMIHSLYMAEAMFWVEDMIEGLMATDLPYRRWAYLDEALANMDDSIYSI